MCCHANRHTPIQLIIPHALQMGWGEPGFFCATTETGRDIMQALIDGGTRLPPHDFDSYMEPEGVVRRQSSPAADRAWQMSDVYVDDYILAAVESRMAPPSSVQGGPHYIPFTAYSPHQIALVMREVKIPSLPGKKLEAGEARWAQSKELLGFVFDGQSRTVHLTQRKASVSPMP